MRLTQWVMGRAHFALPALAGSIVLSIAAKALLDFDTSWDTRAYHLPIASRLWGIIDAGEYVFHRRQTSIFEGFPLLAEFVQGFFWWVLRFPTATNLLNVLSFLGFLAFLRLRLQVPIRLSVFALLAIPVVQAHIATSYVDWVGNCLTTIAILLTYQCCVERGQFSWRSLLGFTAAAVAACNMKFSYLPVIGLLSLLWSWFYIKRIRAQFRSKLHIQIMAFAMIPLIAAMMLAFPIKNTIEHGNPIYPFHKLISSKRTALPEYLSESIQPVRYVLSLVEYDAFDGRRIPWQVGQHTRRRNSPSMLMGGFFGAYVVFNWILMLYLWHLTRDRRVSLAILFTGFLFALNSILPSSHMLRYLMYYMIFLVSINAYLVHLFSGSEFNIGGRFRSLYYIQVISFFAFVVAATGGVHIVPEYRPAGAVAAQARARFDPSLFAEGNALCMIGQMKQARDAIMLSSYFHPEATYTIRPVTRLAYCLPGDIPVNW